MTHQDMPQLSEEELRALEAELERITVDEVLLQTLVSVINLGARRAAGGRWDEVRTAIEAVRALLPLLEPVHGEKLGPVRDAVAQLQMEFARGTQGRGGAEPAGPPPAAGGPPDPGAGGGPGSREAPAEGPGRAQRTGRLWVPGQ